MNADLPENPNQAATPAEATSIEQPAPMTLAWFDAQIAANQQRAQELFAQYNQVVGGLEALVQLRALADKETQHGST